MFNERELLSRIIKNIAFAVIVVIGATVIVGILGGRVSKVSSSLFEKQTVALILEERSANLLRLKKDLQRVGSADARIENALPTPDTILEFVAVLESLASQRSLSQTFRFGSITASPISQATTPLSIIDYNLAFGGNIHILESYLTDLEKLPFFTGVQAFNISSSELNGWAGNSQISLQAKLYIKSP